MTLSKLQALCIFMWDGNIVGYVYGQGRGQLCLLEGSCVLLEGIFSVCTWRY
jgi:hypothetical protein